MPQKEISPKIKQEIEDFVREKLSRYEEIENIFFEQKNDDVFRVLVTTKRINPEIERELLIIEDAVEDRFKVPSDFLARCTSSLLIDA